MNPADKQWQFDRWLRWRSALDNETARRKRQDWQYLARVAFAEAAEAARARTTRA